MASFWFLNTKGYHIEGGGSILCNPVSTWVQLSFCRITDTEYILYKYTRKSSTVQRKTFALPAGLVGTLWLRLSQPVQIHFAISINLLGYPVYTLCVFFILRILRHRNLLRSSRICPLDVYVYCLVNSLQLFGAREFWSEFLTLSKPI